MFCFPLLIHSSWSMSLCLWSLFVSSIFEFVHMIIVPWRKPFVSNDFHMFFNCLIMRLQTPLIYGGVGGDGPTWLTFRLLLFSFSSQSVCLILFLLLLASFWIVCIFSVFPVLHFVAWGCCLFWAGWLQNIHCLNRAGCPSHSLPMKNSTSNREYRKITRYPCLCNPSPVLWGRMTAVFARGNAACSDEGCQRAWGGAGSGRWSLRRWQSAGDDHSPGWPSGFRRQCRYCWHWGERRRWWTAPLAPTL